MRKSIGGNVSRQTPQRVTPRRPGCTHASLSTTMRRRRKCSAQGRHETACRRFRASRVGPVAKTANPAKLSPAQSCRLHRSRLQGGRTGSLRDPAAVEARVRYGKTPTRFATKSRPRRSRPLEAGARPRLCPTTQIHVPTATRICVHSLASSAVSLGGGRRARSPEDAKVCPDRDRLLRPACSGRGARFPTAGSAAPG